MNATTGAIRGSDGLDPSGADFVLLRSRSIFDS